jgi:hypothetical protein
MYSGTLKLSRSQWQLGAVQVTASRSHMGTTSLDQMYRLEQPTRISRRQPCKQDLPQAAPRACVAPVAARLRAFAAPPHATRCAAPSSPATTTAPASHPAQMHAWAGREHGVAPSRQALVTCSPLPIMSCHGLPAAAQVAIRHTRPAGPDPDPAFCLPLAALPGAAVLQC